MKKIRVLSLFDGISCGRVALERAGLSIDKYVAFEIDKYAIQVSQSNYPDIKQAGNIVGADFTPFCGFDLIMGGFPCTDLSIAKKNRQGLKGAQSGLFWELVRAIQTVKPRYFLVENNQSMPKPDRDIITKTLGVEPIMINSALVSAQQRKRLYCTNIPNVKAPQDKMIALKDILEPTYSNGATITADSVICQRGRGKNKGGIKRDKSPTLTSNAFEQNNYVITPVRLGQFGNGGQGGRIYSICGKSVSLSANGGGWGANTGLYKIDLPDGDYVIRKLTPIECERLQTLPDNYTAGISNTQRYKCLGNGWTSDVIVGILVNLKPLLS